MNAIFDNLTINSARRLFASAEQSRARLRSSVSELTIPLLRLCRDHILSIGPGARCKRLCVLAPLRYLLFGFACVLLLPSTTYSQSRLLTAELASSTQAVRTGAPATVAWKLTSHSTSILEGRFRLTILDEREIVGRVLTDEVVLGTGEQIQRVMLPALEVNNPTQTADVHLEFVGQREKIDLGVFSLRFASSWGRQFAICICDPFNNKQSNARQSMINGLRFETYNPDTTDRSAMTATAHLRPDEMPQDGLGYCVYDVALLMEEGFNELRERQLEALADWVDAGGAVFILPAHARLKPSHVAFLNRICHAREDDPEFFADPSGRLSPGDKSPEENLYLVRHGLGRVAVLLGEPERLLQEDPLPYRRIQAFLWRLRNDQLPTFLAKARWDEELTRKTPDPNLPDYVAMGRIRPGNAAVAAVALQSGDQLVTNLLPQDLRVLPLSLVGLLLFAYVLVIGPVDYFVLGALKQRKLTWVLFPAITVGCTWLVVTLAHWYMGVRDDRNAVVFLDIGENNRVVRANRFEVLFSGTQRTARTEVSQGILTAMNHQQFGSSTWYAYQQAMYGYNADEKYKLVGAPQVSGRFPYRFTVAQDLPQWTPQLNRRFSLDNADSTVEFDWNQFADPAVYNPRTLTDLSSQMINIIRARFGAQARVVVFNGDATFNLTGGQTPLFKIPDYGPNYSATRAMPVVNGRVVSSDFLRDTCVFDQGGLFGVVSQIAPTGGRNFEDLTLLDPSDPAQWLLVVAVEKNGNMLIHRKLYMGVR